VVSGDDPIRRNYKLNIFTLAHPHIYTGKLQQRISVPKRWVEHHFAIRKSGFYFLIMSYQFERLKKVGIHSLPDWKFSIKGIV